MHVFDPDLSLKANWHEADEIDYAAWEFAGHEHREEFRDSGHSKGKSAALNCERTRNLREALADGGLIALGISKDDPELELGRIPSNLFLAADVRFDGPSGTITALGREFSSARICLASVGTQSQSKSPPLAGRPNHLPMVIEAWKTLKAEIPSFLQLDLSVQNREIQEMIAKLFPAKFPGNSRIGESTIRRHRRMNPQLFV